MFTTTSFASQFAAGLLAFLVSGACIIAAAGPIVG